MPAWLNYTERFVAAYDVFAVMLLALLWLIGTTGDSKKSASRAANQDPGRNVDFFVALVCILVGLFAAVALLGSGSQVQEATQRCVLFGLGATAVIVGWFIIHTLFLFRYAYLYYVDRDEDREADRGMIFPSTKHPIDSDFAYFSFTIGMTFQVSDVQVVNSGVRRVVLAHGLLSFAYNTLIVALAINISSSALR